MSHAPLPPCQSPDGADEAQQQPVDTKHLGQKQLAARWSISEVSLERWRSEGIGPKFLKLPGRVLYRQVDIEAFEESCLSTSTKTLAGPVRFE